MKVDLRWNIKLSFKVDTRSQDHYSPALEKYAHEHAKEE